MNKHLITIASLIAVTVILAGCSKQSDNRPATAGVDSTQKQSQPAASDQGLSAHEGKNADGIQPTVTEEGITEVGWDELVRNGSQYAGKTVHMKTIVGGVLAGKSAASMGLLFPIDMDPEMMNALVSFVNDNPRDAHGLPVMCAFENDKDVKKIKLGSQVTMEGFVNVAKTGPATGFAQMRGIKQMNYILLSKAKVVKK